VVKRIASRSLSDRLSKIFEGRITFLDLPNLRPDAISLIAEYALHRAKDEVAPLVSLLARHSDGNRASFHQYSLVLLALLHHFSIYRP
jgi:hypothetical protein